MVHKNLYTRRDIAEMIYSEYFSDNMDKATKEVLKSCILHFIKMREDEFIKYVQENAPFILERLRKNLYYIR
jgi:hypothetical protein